MLEEIAPALQPLKRSKMLAPQPSLTGALPQIESKISFKPFVEYLKQKRPTVSETREKLYSYLIKKFESEPSLLKPIYDIELLEEHADLMELLSTSLFPGVCNQQKNIFAIAAPYEFKVFYYAENFRKLFFDNDEQHLLLPDGIPSQELKAIQCSMIYDHVLQKFYGIKLNESPALTYPVTDATTGVMSYYKIQYDRRFIDLHLKGELPSLQECAVCMNTFRILDLEKQLETMPLHLFEAEGFALWVAEDVTINESIEAIKKILLCEKDFDAIGIDDLKKAIKVLIGVKDVEVGLMPFVKVNDQFVLSEETGIHGLTARQWLGHPEEAILFRRYTDFLKEYSMPMPITNLSPDMFEFAPFLKSLYEQGARSFVSYPMQSGDQLIGILELTSPTQNAFTKETIGKLEPAIPLISLAMLKCRDKFQGRIEKVIMEKFTALQQCVEWKFAEVAWEHLRSNGNGLNKHNVVFENVYPLYGAIDIRNSSMERSHAFQKDLKEHLALIANILDELQSRTELPLLEGLAFKNESMRQSIEENITTDDELKINEFLNNEVEPVFIHLQKSSTADQQLIDKYFNTINDNKSSIYRHRCEYEETLSRINDAVMNYLESEEDVIQKSYPHYFDKYRTDGIEYNIYIGESISPNNPFNLLYLKNIRLWQLKSMAEVARITNKLLPQLKVPLQTTQLILVQSQCIDISFRRDERKFDVEGSHNVRYEIIKKRIDKVRIKDTNERLTQPGKIAIVYSNQKEVPEYEEYARFLQKKNILKPVFELLELEELQGIKGLKAMRVEINLDGNN